MAESDGFSSLHEHEQKKDELTSEPTANSAESTVMPTGVDKRSIDSVPSNAKGKLKDSVAVEEKQLKVELNQEEAKMEVKKEEIVESPKTASTSQMAETSTQSKVLMILLAIIMLVVHEIVWPDATIDANQEQPGLITPDTP